MSLRQALDYYCCSSVELSSADSFVSCLPCRYGINCPNGEVLCIVTMSFPSICNATVLALVHIVALSPDNVNCPACLQLYATMDLFSKYAVLALNGCLRYSQFTPKESY